MIRQIINCSPLCVVRMVWRFTEFFPSFGDLFADLGQQKGFVYFPDYEEIVRNAIASSFCRKWGEGRRFNNVPR